MLCRVLPPPAKTPASVVAGSVVAGVLSVGRFTERTLVAGEIRRLSRGLDIVAATDGLIQFGAIPRDVLLHLFHAIVAIAISLAVIRISVLRLIRLLILLLVSPVLGGGGGRAGS